MARADLIRILLDENIAAALKNYNPAARPTPGPQPPPPKLLETLALPAAPIDLANLPSFKVKTERKEEAPEEPKRVKTFRNKFDKYLSKEKRASSTPERPRDRDSSPPREHERHPKPR